MIFMVMATFFLFVYLHLSVSIHTHSHTPKSTDPSPCSIIEQKPRMTVGNKQITEETEEATL